MLNARGRTCGGYFKSMVNESLGVEIIYALDMWYLVTTSSLIFKVLIKYKR
jgi:hypothetical protein